jgi:iron complex transport system substrate-binding protein
LCCGCREDYRETTRDDAAEGTSIITIRDGLDREVSVPPPKNIRRIISLAPACTEILFAIGAGDEVVAVTTFDNYPPEATTREKIGGFSRETISLERIVHFQPDVIFSSGSLQRELIADLERLELVVVALEPKSLDGVMDAVRLAGRITGHDEQADEVAKRIQTSADDVARVLATIPPSQRPRVFYQVWDQPLRTAGSRSYLGHLIELSGGQNIFQDLTEAYPLVSEETVVKRDPQVILAPAHEGTTRQSISERAGWDSVEAVRSGRVYLLDEDLISRPGPRVAQALRTIAQALYPEHFSAGSTGESPE